MLLKRDPVLGSFDPANYATEFLLAPARDGAQIPVSLVYRTGFARDGTAPLLQYGYGAYGLSMDPGSRRARLSLLDRGFVYAIAHVRGGQEMGRAWYDAGQETAQEEHLQRFHRCHALPGGSSGYAAEDKVFAMGGSAGGLLMGAVANMSARRLPRDRRAGAVRRCGHDHAGRQHPADHQRVRRMGQSRLSASTTTTCCRTRPTTMSARKDYPAMFVTTGLWDSQVQYYEPAKWVAKLRALKTDHNRLLLHVDMEAGHGGKSGRFQRYREIAMEYAFLLESSWRSTDKKGAASGRGKLYRGANMTGVTQRNL